MAIYKGKRAGTLRVVVWHKNKPTERTIPDDRVLAKQVETELRKQLMSKRPKRVRVVKLADGTRELQVGKTGEHVVYFVRSGATGPIKIGHTGDLSLRLNNLRCG